MLFVRSPRCLDHRSEDRIPSWRPHRGDRSNHQQLAAPYRSHGAKLGREYVLHWILVLQPTSVSNRRPMHGWQCQRNGEGHRVVERKISSRIGVDGRVQAEYSSASDGDDGHPLSHYSCNLLCKGMRVGKAELHVLHFRFFPFLTHEFKGFKCDRHGRRRSDPAVTAPGAGGG